MEVNTKNRGIFLSLNSKSNPPSPSSAPETKREGVKAFLSPFPQINSTQMKSGNINRPENLGCAPLALKMCLSPVRNNI